MVIAITDPQLKTVEDDSNNHGYVYFVFPQVVVVPSTFS